MNLDEIRETIHRQVAAYYEAAHGERAFVPGQTRVHYAGRVYDEQELIALVDASLDFWLTMGPKAVAFEDALAAYLGLAHALMVNSGSSANLAAIAALCSPQVERPLRPGDEVITPAATFPTTVAPLVQYGLVPVFVDCEPGTYNADPDEVERALSPRTRALFLPHMLGNPCRMDRMMHLAREHDLYVIEDVCEAMDSRFDGKLLGTFGHMSTFSFYPSHHITTGEGGAVATDDHGLARAVRSIRDWGRDCWCDHRSVDKPNGACGRRFAYQVPGVPGMYDHKYLYSNIGYNLRPTDLQAALGLVQLRRLPEFTAARKRNFDVLHQALVRYEEHFILPVCDARADPSWFAFPLTVRDDAPFTRNDVVRWLEEGQIETRLIMAGNILRQPGFTGIAHRAVGDLAHTDQVMRGGFFVGIYPGLDEVQLAYVIERFEAFFARRATFADPR